MLKKMVRSHGAESISTLFVPNLSRSGSAHFVDSSSVMPASPSIYLSAAPLPVRSRSMNSISNGFFSVPAEIKSSLPDQIQSITDKLTKETISPLAPNWWLREEKQPAEAKEMEVSDLVYRYFAALDRQFAHRKERDPTDVSMYHCEEAPPILLVDYYKRFERALHLNPVEGLFSLCLLNAFICRRHDVNFNIFSAHRLLTISIGTTTKFMQDKAYCNTHIAKTGGITLKDYNNMEVDLLASINFDLYKILSPESYDRLLTELKKHFAPTPSSVKSTETAVPTPSQQPPRM